MADKNAKSKGNTARRAGHRNNGLPAGITRAGSTNRLSGATSMLALSTSLYEMARREKLLRRWGVRPNLVAE